MAINLGGLTTNINKISLDKIKKHIEENNVIDLVVESKKAMKGTTKSYKLTTSKIFQDIHLFNNVIAVEI